MNTLDKIEKYGISIRQIPKVVIGKFAIKHFKEGDEIDGNFCIRKTIPSNAGYWMSKIEKSNMSTVRWDINKHNLAKTLPESVELCVVDYLFNLHKPDSLLIVQDKKK